MTSRSALLIAAVLLTGLACSDATDQGETVAPGADPDPAVGAWTDDLGALARNMGKRAPGTAIPPAQREALRNQAARYQYEFLLDVDGHAMRHSVANPGLAPMAGHWEREGDRIVVTLEDGPTRIVFTQKGEHLIGKHPELKVQRRLRRGRSRRTSRR